MRTGTRRLAATIVVALWVPAFPGTSYAAGETCSLPPGELTVSDLPEGESVIECDAVGRVVVNDGLGLEVPDPGYQVTVEALYPNGSQQFSIEVNGNGVLSYAGDPNDADLNGDDESGGLITNDTRWDAEGTLQSTACTQTAYTDKDEEQAGTWQWYLGDGARPAGMTTDAARDALRDSVQNITYSDNDCGLYDQVDADAGYQGIDSHETDIYSEDSQSKCGDRDNYSTVDFGNLDGNGNPPLAMECTWVFPQPFNDNNILESDVRINTVNFSWTNTPGSNCYSAYDLRAIATHEFGHTFGLGHVSESDYPTLTMSTSTAACDGSQRTLGRGDVYGLRNTY